MSLLNLIPMRPDSEGSYAASDELNMVQTQIRI